MTEPDQKALSRGVSSDMSPEAIARRLRIVSELYDLARVLGRTRYLGKADEAGVRGPLRRRPEP